MCSFVAAKTGFFVDSLHMLDLRQRDHYLREWCTETLIKYGYNNNQPVFGNIDPSVVSRQFLRDGIRSVPPGIYQDACLVPEYGVKSGLPANLFDYSSAVRDDEVSRGASITCGHVSVMTQCMAEQKWMRESMLRSLLYAQVCSCLCLCLQCVHAMGELSTRMLLASHHVLWGMESFCHHRHSCDMPTFAKPACPFQHRQASHGCDACLPLALHVPPSVRLSPCRQFSYRLHTGICHDLPTYVLFSL